MKPAALILAGSRGGEEPVATYAGVAEKALIDVAGTSMLSRVIEALRQSGVSRIVVSASAADVLTEAARNGAETVAAASGPSASTALALRQLGAPLLVATADHALLRPEWVSNFLDAVPAGADVAALLARRESVEAAAPGSKRTYLRFADGQWSGCNLFYLATPRAEAIIRLWQEVEQDRKRPWRIVRRLGPLLLLRYLVGRLSLAEAIRRLGRRAGVEAVPVECRDGLAAVDVDKPSDLDFVQTRLAQLHLTRQA